ncbi:DUF4384 domain-containing protein [Planktothrix agardhii]|jgi:hypothetical protein|uniref:DUF4384 domain-containing protein n=1 Tax=Planktothrix agardhii TaxID=1160 RepID=UPI001A2B8BC8|nr:DUF4384 domain-containing protein [Planktothrix agardhii]MBG0747877.1 DUF4384 domain-containing protein [Planktothrix agardhii KL2]MCF3576948.1 DUF4384 domain-containing protein [Planktothrix agardhii 1812]MCF3582932.1 DUF4384 domain-containing protein [Planktothrix agardhii 1811]MCF3623797.1 DUF4384 domain-containing protein [Planktothrix agardhii 1801]CAD5924545.1 hypothetical protein NO976_00918 [Planktothrix agardhii]
MISKEYNDNEDMFLNAIADQWGFKDRCKLVFVERFRSSNDDLTHDALADVLEDNLKNTKSNLENYQQVLKDYLTKNIFTKMTEQGCDFKSRDKSLSAKSWLRGTVYLQWLKQKLWDELKTQTTAKNRMGPVLPSLSSLKPRPKSYLDTVPLHSDFLFKINLDQPGHLILLEREPSGGMYCWCPSEYAPQSYLDKGEITLPQSSAPNPAFAPVEEGKEQLLAVVTPEQPSLNWLAKSQQEALELDHQHLYELLTYVEERSESQVFYTEYQVVDVLKTV